MDEIDVLAPRSSVQSSVKNSSQHSIHQYLARSLRADLERQ